MALLTGDSSALLLAAMAKDMEREDRTAIFNFHTYDSTICKKEFRFEKQDISRLYKAFGIPITMKMADGSKFDGIEGECKK
jgi:hypothetical protein